MVKVPYTFLPVWHCPKCGRMKLDPFVRHHDYTNMTDKVWCKGTPKRLIYRYTDHVVDVTK